MFKRCVGELIFNSSDGTWISFAMKEYILLL